jgi:hypothetical protein
MSSTSRIVLRLLAAALLGLPWVAHAQDARSYFSGANYRLQFYLGGSLGGSIFDDRRGATAGWFDGSYDATTPLASGDYVGTFSRQDQGGFGAKVYGGAWITPNVGVELGFASLGRIDWSTYSQNTTGSFSVGNSGTVAPHTWYEAVLLGFDNNGIRYFVKGGAYEASTNLFAGGFNFNNGAALGGSQTVHNTGGLAGLGIYSGFGHTALRLELEDFIDVGSSSMPVSSGVPPWRGNVLLISAGVAYLF